MTDTSAKIIVITGVTRGLGRALAEELAAQGHTIVGCGRSEGLLAALRVQLAAPHSFCRVDVRHDRDVAVWAKRAVADYGAPDLLVNNAGLIHEPALLHEVPEATFSRVIDVNLKGVAAVLRHFLPAMRSRGRGVIVNVSSTWGRTASPRVAPYCATKWAIEGLTRALAQELPDGMAAVAFNPGVVHTQMLETALGVQSARGSEDPKAWSIRAARLILALGPEHNGRSV